MGIFLDEEIDLECFSALQQADDFDEQWAGGILPRDYDALLELAAAVREGLIPEAN